mmetsp:Transcript_8011/g.23790  ORF Transcript_8011/g.23790 Transcript_8011/m.23790 type:complete len:690 (-) Transcript_8011:105-2174(-)
MEDTLPSRSHFIRRGSVFALDLDGGQPHYRLVSRSIVSATIQTDNITIKEATYFISYSKAIYEALPAFVQKSQRRHLCLFPLPVRFKDRSVLSLDGGIDLEEIGFDSTTVVYLQPENGIDKTPYCILVDEKCKTVVVAIRGTASFEDIVIDLQLTPSKMDGVGRRCGFDGTDQFCHRGVLTRCRWLYDDLVRHGILDELLLGERPLRPRYRLVITGHSLGAGCASVLSLMLRQRFPAVQCYAFCPPGGLLTKKLAEVCESFVVSVINDTDIIPRLSHDNLERLRDEWLEVLGRIKISKYKITRILSKPCSDKQLVALNAKLLFGEEDLPQNLEYHVRLETFKARNDVQRERNDATRVPLYPPGKIIYLVKSKHLLSLGFRTLKNRYTPQWAEKTDFNEILMSRTAVHDHSLYVVIENLQSIMNAFQGDNGCVSIEDINEEESVNFDDSLRLLENDFVCCSFPQGVFAIIPAVLGLVAIVLTGMATFTCKFAATDLAVKGVESDECQEDESGHLIWFQFGLWHYLDKEYSGDDPADGPDSYVGVCTMFPTSYEIGPHLNAARVFGTLSSLLGAGTLILMWFVVCYSYGKNSWYFISAMLLTVSLFEGLVFLVFGSSICSQFELTALPNSRCPLTSLSETCIMSGGAKMGLAATIIWFFAALVAAKCGRQVGNSGPRFRLRKDLKKKWHRI